MFRRGFNHAPLRCIAGDLIIKVLKETRLEDSGKNQGALGCISRSFIWVITGPPWKLIILPSLADAKHAKLIFTGSIFLQYNCISYLPSGQFTSGFLVCPTNPPSAEVIYGS